MNDFKSLLNSDPTDWLLEHENPSVRYFTLKDILGKHDGDKEVKKAKKNIMRKGLVPKILEKQKKGGYWGKQEDFYIRSKYKGTVWNLIILAELGSDGDDKCIKNACEFILDWSQDRESGGFSYQGSKVNGGHHSKVLPCLTGNMDWCLIKFGYLGDPRVKKGIDWITTYQRFDDGVKKKTKGWLYDKYEMCWGKHTCHMGVVKILKALAEIPPRNRTKAVKTTIEEGTEFILKHHVHKRSHNLDKVSKPSWLKLGFPLMWQTDVLEILGILTKLGYKDDRMQEAIDLVISKQDEKGRWKLENTFNGRYLVSIERKGKPSKWVTLNALKVLKKI